MPEHVVLFGEYASRYPYAADGNIPGNPTGVLDPMAALTYLAAHTANRLCSSQFHGNTVIGTRNAPLCYLSVSRVPRSVGCLCGA